MLAGKVLSAETLRWVIDAFEMTPHDADILWDAFFRGDAAESEIAHTLRRRREMIRRQCHRTANLVERYTVDDFGALRIRHTTHTIRAVEDGVDVYIFNHEPQANRVDVIYGGTAGRRHQYGGGLHCVEIELDRRLNRGDTIGLDYCTYFVPAGILTTEVRRAAFGRLENLDLAVRFEGSVPRYAWWCVWDDHLEGLPVCEHRVDIVNGSIRQFTRSVEQAVVGFRWVW